MNQSRYIFSVFVLAVSMAGGQTLQDPGPRASQTGAGRPLEGLTSSQMAFFNKGLETFAEVEDVSAGLGPTFNLDSCGGCHAFPAIGGSSPAVNPQIASAVAAGAQNRVPRFLSPNGPVREVRMVYRPGTKDPDGGVAGLFSIAGRWDAAGCVLPQTNFDDPRIAGNIVFRIPTPVFGAGLIESIPDATILANRDANAAQKRAMGINGHTNTIANDGTIGRFGWKAQNKSLMIFSGEAYNVEMGVTNELFPNARDGATGCGAAVHPEDATRTDEASAVEAMPDVAQFAMFMRFLDAPRPGPASAAATHGRDVFGAVGCALCHTPSLTTGKSGVAALSEKRADLYSDLLVHRMGAGLADRISQGDAGPDEFRTAPLWGLGQRLFFLHDGRTSDLVEAIRAHRSGRSRDFAPSEVSAVVDAFDALSPRDAQDLQAFLRSL